MTDDKETRAAASAIKALQDKARKEGRGEMRGAVKKVMRSLAQIMDELGAIAEDGASLETKVSRKKPKGMAPVRPGTDQARVLEIVRTKPGLKGVEIAGLMLDASERTIRTSLRRLSKVRGLIEMRLDGGWHPKQGTK